MSTTLAVQELAFRARGHGYELVRVHERDHPFNPGSSKLCLRRPNSRLTAATGTVDELEARLDAQESAA